MKAVTYPTFAAELLARRDGLTLADQIGLASRSGRRASGLSQRRRARQLGWPQSRMRRLESSAGNLPLDDILTGLRDSGYVLYLARAVDLPDGSDPCPPTGGAAAPAPVRPCDWPRAELLAEVRGGGRRLAGHLEAYQCSSQPPGWWMMRESTSAFAVPPHWSTRPPPASASAA